MRARLAAVTLAVAACVEGSGGTPLPGVFVGAMADGRGLVAVVADADGVEVYACGIGDALAARTGWVFTVPADTSTDGRSGALAGRTAGGLDLAGRYGPDGASGTLTQADGTVVDWSAEPALRETGAGIYRFEEATVLAGLIVTNDGRMAGNAKVSLDGTSTSTAVTVLTPPGGTTPPGSPADPGPADPGGGDTGGAAGTSTLPTGSFTLPGDLGTRVVTLTPLAKPTTVTPKGPLLIFLVHGMSESVDTPTAGAAEDLAACTGPRDTPFYSRCEWGIDFLPGLFGGAAGTVALTSLAGDPMTGALFLSEPRNRPLVDEHLGLASLDANGCSTDPTAPERLDPRVAHHLVTTGTPKAGVPPGLTVMVLWRDSTRGIVESARRVTNQAYLAARFFEATYRVTPAIVFVGQSFGGLASRTVLSNPAARDLADGTFNADRVPVCAEERARMDWLRDRTLYLLTLATPHEGSYLAEAGEPLRALAKDTVRALQGLIADNPLSRAIRAADAAAPLVVPRPPPVSALAVQELDRLLGAIDTPALRDLRLARMESINRGPLSPEKARRTRGSPIAGAAGTLVPVYATLGRSPGGTAFDSPNVLDGFGRWGEESPKEQGWIAGTMWAGDFAIRQVFPGGFGSVGAAPYRGFERILDRRERLFDLSDDVDDVEAFVATTAGDALRRMSRWFAGRFGDGVGGLLDWATDVRLGLILPSPMVPIHTGVKWTLGFDAGHTLEVPMVGFACGGSVIPLDAEDLVNVVLDRFVRTADALATLQGMDLLQVLRTGLGLVVESGGAVVEGFARWMRDKQAALGAVADECDLGSGDPLDLFGVANLPNWRVVQTTGPIAVPTFVPTAEPAFDGEMDDDGAVHSASALGFTLGRRAFFFEHDRADGPAVNGQATFGSWYRLHDNPATEKYNHGMQYQNDVGRWIRDTFLVARVGPVPRRDGLSSWP